MPKTIQQLQNELTGRKRIKKAAERAWLFNNAFFLDGRMSYFSNRFKTNRGKEIN